MSDTKAGRQRKNLKLHWLKRPEKIPKKTPKFGPENKRFKTSDYLLVSDFLVESLKANKN